MKRPTHRLAIDVGNSRIKLGLFEADASQSGAGLPRCLQAWAVPVADDPPWSDLASACAARGIGTVEGVAAGANPQGIARVCDTWPDAWSPPRVITDPTSLPIAIRLAFPRRVGIDRVLNAVAANVVRPPGRPAIVVDTGTATTVDLIGTDGAFEGGAILPGFELCARALHFYTALLPQISIEELATQPRDPLGRETRAALRSGLFWGQLGAVKELIARLSGVAVSVGPCERAESEVALTKAPLVLLTGGGAALLAPYLPEARSEPALSLQGIVLAAIDSVDHVSSSSD